MPKIVKPDHRRVPITIEQRYLTRAGAMGCDGVEAYIDKLEATTAKLLAIKDALQEEIKKLEKELVEVRGTHA